MFCAICRSMDSHRQWMPLTTVFPPIRSCAVKWTSTGFHWHWRGGSPFFRLFNCLFSLFRPQIWIESAWEMFLSLPKATRNDDLQALHTEVYFSTLHNSIHSPISLYIYLYLLIHRRTIPFWSNGVLVLCTFWTWRNRYYQCNPCPFGQLWKTYKIWKHSILSRTLKKQMCTKCNWLM